jgi:TP901 family phage tail tape measure protein
MAVGSGTTFAFQTSGQAAVITGVKGIDNAFSGLEYRIITFNQALDLARRTFRSVEIVMGAIAGPAISAESAFAGVKRTVEATNNQLEELRKTMMGMTRTLPVSVDDIYKLGEAAGQLGVATADIENFAETAVRLGVATNMSAEEAIVGLAKLKNMTGTAGDKLTNLASALVELGVKSAATESEILDMTLRIAGAASVVGVGEDRILAFGTALASLGVRSDAGGSAISRMMLRIGEAASTGGHKLELFAEIAAKGAQKFTQLWKTDRSAAIRASVDAFKAGLDPETGDPARVYADFLKGLGQMKKGSGEQYEAVRQLGLQEIRLRDALLRVAAGYRVLESAMKLNKDAYEKDIALQRQSEVRFATIRNQLTLLANDFTRVAIAVGNDYLPAMRDMISATRDWVAANEPALAEGMRGVMEGMGKTAQVAAPYVGKFALAIGELAASFDKIPEWAKGAFLLGMAIPQTRPLTSAIAAGGIGAHFYGKAAEESGQSSMEYTKSGAAWLGSKFVTAYLEDVRKTKEGTLEAGDALSELGDVFREFARGINTGEVREIFERRMPGALTNDVFPSGSRNRVLSLSDFRRDFESLDQRIANLFVGDKGEAVESPFDGALKNLTQAVRNFPAPVDRESELAGKAMRDLGSQFASSISDFAASAKGAVGELRAPTELELQAPALAPKFAELRAPTEHELKTFFKDMGDRVREGAEHLRDSTQTFSEEFTDGIQGMFEVPAGFLKTEVAKLPTATDFLEAWLKQLASDDWAKTLVKSKYLPKVMTRAELYGEKGGYVGGIPDESKELVQWTQNFTAAFDEQTKAVMRGTPILAALFENVRGEMIPITGEIIDALKDITDATKEGGVAFADQENFLVGLMGAWESFVGRFSDLQKELLDSQVLYSEQMQRIGPQLEKLSESYKSALYKRSYQEELEELAGGPGAVGPRQPTEGQYYNGILITAKMAAELQEGTWKKWFPEQFEAAKKAVEEYGSSAALVAEQERLIWASVGHTVEGVTFTYELARKAVDGLGESSSGLSAVEQRRLDKIFEMTNAQRQQTAAEEETVRQRRASVDPLYALAEGMRELRAQEEAYAKVHRDADLEGPMVGGMTPEVSSRLREQLWDQIANDMNSSQERWNEYFDTVNRGFSSLMSVVDNFCSSFEDTLAETLLTGKGDWKGFFESLAKDLLKWNIHQALVMPIETPLKKMMAQVAGYEYETIGSVKARAEAGLMPEAIANVGQRGQQAIWNTANTQPVNEGPAYSPYRLGRGIEVQPPQDSLRLEEHYTPVTIGHGGRPSLTGYPTSPLGYEQPYEVPASPYRRGLEPTGNGPWGEGMAPTGDVVEKGVEEMGTSWKQETVKMGSEFVGMLQWVGGAFNTMMGTLLTALIGGQPDVSAGGFFKSLAINTGGAAFGWGMGALAAGPSQQTRIPMTQGEQMDWNAANFGERYASAPKKHSGGLASNEMPAILQRGELVVPKEHVAGVLSGAGGAGDSGGGGSGGIMINLSMPIGVTSLDPRGAAAVIQAQMPQIEAGIYRAIERGGTLARAVGRRS